MNELEIYIDEGYLLKNKLISENNCQNILKFIESRESTLNIPFSSVSWGYGNLVDCQEMASLTQNIFITKFCKMVLGEDFLFNHLMVNNKAPWIGPDVEWHQEIFNVNTYAPGANISANSWKDFIANIYSS